jgi:hypothetical protein
MNIIDLGPIPPSIQTYGDGYIIPVAVEEVQGPSPTPGETMTRYQGYMLKVPFLTEHEVDKAFASLPPGDYEADRKAALNEAVHQSRKKAYPPVEDYIDGIVKNDQAQIAAYKAKCLQVKEQFPLF